MMRTIDPWSKTLRETRILLLRHAETAAPDRFHGAESDVGLGRAGHLQAAAVAAGLARLRPDALYCSGMLRARETAAPIGRECNLVPRVVEALHERKMGPLSGQSREEGWSTYEQAKARWAAGELEFTHEGGESYAEIRRRVVPALLDIALREAGRTAVVVAHGVVIRVLLTSLVDGLGPADFAAVPIDYVAVNDLRWDGARWRLDADHDVSTPGPPPLRRS